LAAIGHQQTYFVASLIVVVVAYPTIFAGTVVTADNHHI
jgi:hypothetical protein